MIDIRYSEIKDKVYLHKWISDPEILKWYPPNNEKELAPFIDNWIGFSKFKASLTATFEKEVCGIGTLFLMPYRKVAHHCFFYMVIDPLRTKQGIGAVLLKNMLNLAKNYFELEAVTAEVFEGSVFIKLLEKNHFEVFAVQDNYVKDQEKYKQRILYQLFLKEVL